MRHFYVIASDAVAEEQSLWNCIFVNVYVFNFFQFILFFAANPDEEVPTTSGGKKCRNIITLNYLGLGFPKLISISIAASSYFRGIAVLLVAAFMFA